jgi:hypothetical protein
MAMGAEPCPGGHTQGVVARFETTFTTLVPSYLEQSVIE